jgi:HSP20 family protein
MAEKAKEREAKALAPRRPFMGLTRWETDMDRMMDEFFGRRMRSLWPDRWFGRETESEITAPSVDVYEEKDDIVVKAELPGMDKNDIEVNVSDSHLVLKGEKKKEEKIEEKDYYRCERSYGAFVRAVDLPTDVQTEKIKASFKNGILEVRLPKTEQAKSKQIKIHVE